jgi:hypothetical protein
MQASLRRTRSCCHTFGNSTSITASFHWRGYCLGIPPLESLYDRDRVLRSGLESYRNEVPSVPHGSIHRQARLRPSDASGEPMRMSARLLRCGHFDPYVRRKVVCWAVHNHGVTATDRRGPCIDPLPPEVDRILGGAWRVVPNDNRTSRRDRYAARAVVECERPILRDGAWKRASCQDDGRFPLPKEGRWQ